MRSDSQLQDIARQLRLDVVSMVSKAQSGHVGGALGMADVFAALYWEVLHVDPSHPRHPERDRVILSNGHICALWYAALARRGFFEPKELDTFRQLNSRLQGHPHAGSIPGVEFTSGMLGQGLSQGIGVAQSLRLSGNGARVYVLMGDGEQQEGQNWEAYWYAGAHHLANLTVLIDRNNIQIDGHTEEILSLEPFSAKLQAFGWNVLSVQGHDHEAIIDACAQAKLELIKPTALICLTTPGKGVPFMENNPHWHGAVPSQTQTIEALAYLQQNNS